MARTEAEAPTILGDEGIEKFLSAALGPRAATLMLIPQDGSNVARLPFNWTKAKEYYTAFCPQGGGNDCPDGEFELDCTHFICHGLSKTKIIVNLPTAMCANGVCIRVAELFAAFKNSVAKYSNVKKIDDLTKTREGDFCFITSWFGLSTDHVMALAGAVSSTGGSVWGHTNPRCAAPVDLTGQTLVVYRIE